MNAKPKRQDRELALVLMRMHCRELQIPDPQPEFHFCADRDWRFDFAWPDWRIAIEVEGGAFGVHDRFGRFHRGESGRHTRGAGFVRDLEKYNRAVADGWRLLRFTPAQMQRAEWREPVLKLMARSMPTRERAADDAQLDRIPIRRRVQMPAGAL